MGISEYVDSLGVRAGALRAGCQLVSARLGVALAAVMVDA